MECVKVLIGSSAGKPVMFGEIESNGMIMKSTECVSDVNDHMTLSSCMSSTSDSVSKVHEYYGMTSFNRTQFYRNQGLCAASVAFHSVSTIKFISDSRYQSLFISSSNPNYTRIPSPLNSESNPNLISIISINSINPISSIHNQAFCTNLNQWLWQILFSLSSSKLSSSLYQNPNLDIAHSLQNTVSIQHIIQPTQNAEESTTEIDATTSVFLALQQLLHRECSVFHSFMLSCIQVKTDNINCESIKECLYKMMLHSDDRLCIQSAAVFDRNSRAIIAFCTRNGADCVSMKDWNFINILSHAIFDRNARENHYCESMKIRFYSESSSHCHPSLILSVPCCIHDHQNLIIAFHTSLPSISHALKHFYQLVSTFKQGVDSNLFEKLEIDEKLTHNDSIQTAFVINLQHGLMWNMVGTCTEDHIVTVKLFLDHCLSENSEGLCTVKMLDGKHVLRYAVNREMDCVVWIISLEFDCNGHMIQVVGVSEMECDQNGDEFEFMISNAFLDDVLEKVSKIGPHFGSKLKSIPEPGLFRSVLKCVQPPIHQT